jgi:opacity protein-like surface antigen
LSRDRFLRGFVAAIALPLLLPAVAGAYDFRLTPSVGVREEYNNNLFFARDDEEDNWLTTVSPGLELAWKTERLDAALSGTAYWMNYSSDSDLDTTDSAAKGRLAWNLTPEFRLSARGEFRRESRPDRHFEEAGLVDRSKDYRQIYNAAAQWTVTEKSAVSASYGFERLDYPDLTGRDADVHSAGLGFVHDLSRFTELTQARTNFGYSHGSYDAISIDSYSLTVGLYRSVHELWSVMVNAGAMHIRSEFDDWFGSGKKTDHTGWTGDASLIYTGETSGASLTFSHGLSPAYGYSGATIRTAAILGAEKRFIHDVAATLSAGYYINKSDAGDYSTQDIDERSFVVRPGLRWKPSKYVSLDAAYQYRHIDYRLSDGNASQQVVYAGVNLSYPFFDE